MRYAGGDHEKPITPRVSRDCCSSRVRSTYPDWGVNRSIQTRRLHSSENGHQLSADSLLGLHPQDTRRSDGAYIWNADAERPDQR